MNFALIVAAIVFGPFILLGFLNLCLAFAKGSDFFMRELQSGRFLVTVFMTACCAVLVWAWRRKQNQAMSLFELVKQAVFGVNPTHLILFGPGGPTFAHLVGERNGFQTTVSTNLLRQSNMFPNIGVAQIHISSSCSQDLTIERHTDLQLFPEATQSQISTIRQIPGFQKLLMLRKPRSRWFHALWQSGIHLEKEIKEPITAEIVRDVDLLITLAKQGI